MIGRFNLVVFDWDGTLIDSTGVIARSIQAAALDLGLAVPSLERARHVIGLGLRDALAHAVPELDASKAAAFSARYREHYLRQEESLELYEGAIALLDAIAARGVTLAVATGKTHLGLMRVLQATGLKSRFAATRCADQTHSKPHPAMLLELMDELHVTPERTLMVGDTTHDLQMAGAAGTAAVALTHGAHPREQLAPHEPLALFDSLPQFQAWLNPG